MARIGATRTAAGVGIMRALEGYAREPLFDDPLAGRMVTGWAAVMLRRGPLRRAFRWAMERAGPGFYGAVVCRTRVIDDACRDGLAAGLRQVVIVGAGMDTRPYRIAAMAQVPVWELDLPAVQRDKKAALRRVLGTLPGHVRYAPIDLVARPVGDVLAEAGADLAAPSLVLCEAVSMYLPEGAVEDLLAYAASLPAGSRFVFTYLSREIRDDPRQAGWARRLGWRTAFEPAGLARRLAGLGLRVDADLGADEYRALPGRAMTVFPGERVVVSVRTGPDSGTRR